MKFKAKIKGFLHGLEPVFTVATKGVAKDYRNAHFVSISASEEGIRASADGGRMSLTNMIDGVTFSNLNYECFQPGNVTLRASDLRKTLLSFNPEDEVIFEIRQATAVKDEDADDVPNDAPQDQEPQLQEAVQAATMIDEGIEVVCTLVSDPEEFQTLQCSLSHIDPSLSEPLDESDELKIRRDLFVSSAQRISFAQGFEDYRPMYLYWVVRASKGSIRFVAGSGGRFAVLEMLGDAISNASKKQTLLIPNWQTPAIIEVFGKMAGEFLSFYVGERQMVIRCGSVQVVISQIDPNIKWPDESSLLDRESRVKFTTKVGNWFNAVKGISATYSDDIKKQRHIHTASISFDAKSKVLLAKANDQLKSNRKVAVEDMWTDDSSPDISFKCVSKYVDEVIKNGDENSFIQVEMNDANTPVIIRYHASDKVGEAQHFVKTNEILGISERYTIFFAPRTKER